LIDALYTIIFKVTYQKMGNGVDKQMSIYLNTL